MKNLLSILFVGVLLFAASCSQVGQDKPNPVTQDTVLKTPDVEVFVDALVTDKIITIEHGEDNTLKRSIIGGAAGYVGGKLLGVKGSTPTLLGAGVGYGTSTTTNDKVITQFITKVGSKYHDVFVDGQSSINAGDSVIVNLDNHRFISKY